MMLSNCWMLIFGLILWASLLSFAEAMRIPPDGNTVKRVRWGVNKERVYRLPAGFTSRNLQIPASMSTVRAFETECTCGICASCRTKRMIGEREGSEERLFGFGGGGYGSSYYDGYGSSMGFGPQSSYYDPYNPYYSPGSQYDTFGYDPYYGGGGYGQQYPHYW